MRGRRSAGCRGRTRAGRASARRSSARTTGPPHGSACSKALAKDRNDWVTWLDLVAATSGKAQLAALVQASRLNPLGPEIAQVYSAVARP